MLSIEHSMFGMVLARLKSERQNDMTDKIRVAVASFVIEGLVDGKLYFENRCDAEDYARNVATHTGAELTTYEMTKKVKQY